MLITKEIEIDMAHRVPNHKSKCKNLHGHRYKIEIGVDDKIITEPGSSSEGMVIDYSDLKDTMIRLIENPYDHNSMFHKDDPICPLVEKIAETQTKYPCFVNFIPTAENLAKHWYEIMKEGLQQVNINIKHVKVWETPTSTAIYEEN